MPVCKGCGGSYDDSFKFCPSCGRAKPKPTSVDINVKVTSEDVWETCEICLVYTNVKANSLGGALGLKNRQWLFEATAIGQQGRYGAALSETLTENHFWSFGEVGDYHYPNGTSLQPILHKDYAQTKVDALIKKLVADGWQPISRGEHWYSERFRRLVKKQKSSS